HFSSSHFSSPCALLSSPTAPTVLSTLSLHDALPIYRCRVGRVLPRRRRAEARSGPVARGATRGAGVRGGPRRRGPDHARRRAGQDRKSTRLNSSHVSISYAVFCLKKKKKRIHPINSD